MKKDSLKSVIVLTVICLIVALLLSTVNMITTPLIAKADEQAANAAYFEVLPEATEFEVVQTGELPASVVELKKDLGGSGYGVKLSTTSSYSQSPLIMILGVDKTGAITKLAVVNYAETKDVGDEFYSKFEKQDSTLKGVDVVAGCTFSSNAIINAVKDAYTAIFEYGNLEKSDEQKLDELMAVIMPGAINKSGSYEFESVAIESPAAGITGAYTSENDIGYIITAETNGKKLAIGVNAFGYVYHCSDLDGNDLLNDEAYKDIIKAAKETFEPLNKKDDAKTQKSIKKLLSDSATLTLVDVQGINSTVASIYKVKDGNTNGYAIVAQTLGFGGKMKLCYILNNDGDIVKFKALSQKEESVESTPYGTLITEKSYASKIEDKTVDTLTEEDILVAQSTYTTNAVKLAWNDVKAAFETLTGEGK